MLKLFKQIEQDLKQAMLKREEEKVSALRMLLSALKNRQIKLRQKQSDALSNEQILAVIKSEVKKRKDSVETYLAGGRRDLADKESREIAILEGYLPEQLSQEETEKIVRQLLAEQGEVSRKDFGKIMGLAMARLKGRVDGGQVSAAVKKILAE